MTGYISIAIALIGAFAGVTGSFFTSQATADTRVADVDTKVQVLENTQTLQYRELKEGLTRIENKLDKALK